MEHLVFVFGTLKEGFPNFATNRGARIPGEFKTRVPYPLYLVGERHSPWLMDEPGKGFQVTGQIFRVDSRALAAMDALERISEPDGYRRKILELEAPSNLAKAFAYVKQPAQLVESEVRTGPLAEYKHEHAHLYRPRVD